MVQYVTQRISILIVPIEVRVAGVETRGKRTIWVVEHRFRWQAVIEASPGVALVVAQNGQCGVVAWLPRQSRRNVEPLLLVVVDLCLGVPCQAGQSVEKVAILIEGATEIEGTLEPAVAPGLELDLVQGLDRRPLADQVHDTAWKNLTVEYRCRAMQQFNALKRIRVE